MKIAEASGPLQQLDRAIEGLRQKFLNELDERIFGFEEALAQLRNGRDRNEVMRQIHNLAHKQAGIAPSLGFSRIGELSRNVEVAIDNAISNQSDTSDSGAWHDALNLLVDEMERLLPDIGDVTGTHS